MPKLKMSNKEKRRREIILYLENENRPISGTALADHFKVSRQTIVHDLMALKELYPFLESTSTGYFLPDQKVRRIFYVCHQPDKMEQEMHLICSLKGIIEDVGIFHPVYGKLTAPLFIHDQEGVDQFCIGLEKQKGEPLAVLTNGEHFHTVSATNWIILDEIEERLKQEGFYLSSSEVE